MSKECMKKDYQKNNLILIASGRKKRGRPKTRWKEGALRAMEERCP
jgi:hypothetical protein